MEVFFLLLQEKKYLYFDLDMCQFFQQNNSNECLSPLARTPHLRSVCFVLRWTCRTNISKAQYI